MHDKRRANRKEKRRTGARRDKHVKINHTIRAASRIGAEAASLRLNARNGQHARADKLLPEPSGIIVGVDWRWLVGLGVGGGGDFIRRSQ